jgi:UDP-N-acetylglucosamine transferase subunit ALG13
MNSVLPQKIKGKPRILVVPLDWGLGHATRCIPLIRKLLDKNVDVWLAGEGLQEKLLKEEFPGLPFLSLTGYRVAYGRSGKGLMWKMMWQINHIRKMIRAEKQWLNKMVADHKINAVISDNRYGLYHSSIPSVIITHQLQIKTGMGKWCDKQIQKWNYNYLQRFTECWVPDLPGKTNLAGDLSHPDRLPFLPVHYIGILSRFDPTTGIAIKKGKLLVLLSGPEPQRSLLEERMISEIAHYNGDATILRGLPGNHTLIPSSNMIKFYNHLSTNELRSQMLEAEYVISRSGYSTIMDAIQMNKKCIFIPTPGQTEQVYLARELTKKSIAVSMEQEKFSLNESLMLATSFPYELPLINNEELEPVIERFLSGLKIYPALG